MRDMIYRRPALLAAVATLALFVARFGGHYGGRGFHHW